MVLFGFSAHRRDTHTHTHRWNKGGASMLYMTGACLTMAAMENGANLYLCYWSWRGEGAEEGAGGRWCVIDKRMLSPQEK